MSTPRASVQTAGRIPSSVGAEAPAWRAWSRHRAWAQAINPHSGPRSQGSLGPVKRRPVGQRSRPSVVVATAGLRVWALA